MFMMCNSYMFIYINVQSKDDSKDDAKKIYKSIRLRFVY